MAIFRLPFSALYISPAMYSSNFEVARKTGAGSNTGHCITPDVVQKRWRFPFLSVVLFVKRWVGRNFRGAFHARFLLSLNWAGQHILFSWLALSTGVCVWPSWFGWAFGCCWVLRKERRWRYRASHQHITEDAPLDGASIVYRIFLCLGDSPRFLYAHFVSHSISRPVYYYFSFREMGHYVFVEAVSVVVVMVTEYILD